jgi:peptide/nickel transport system substrate-binding protein
MPISTRRACLLLCGLTLAAAACKGDEPRAGGSSTPGAEVDAGPPVSGGTAVVADLTDMEKPMPLVSQSQLDSDLIDIMYMALTRMVWRDGRPDYLLYDESPMAIAYRYQYVGADSSALRFYMRSNLRWSDGFPLTAEDVVWTYRSIKDQRVASTRQQDVNLIDSVRAENDSVVVFYFKRRSPSMLFQAGIGIVPKHAYEDVAPSRIRTHSVFSNPTRMVVSGPFRIGAWRANERLTLVQNPWFKPKARLNAIVLRVIPDPTARLTELETGGVDFARPVSLDHVRGLQQRMPSVRILREERRFWEFISYNPRRVPAFADPQIRRALGMAIDMPGIIRDLQLGDYVQQAYGPYPPIFKDLFDAERDRPLAHDPAGARRILESRGWRDTNGDGIVEKDGKPFQFTLLTNAGNQRRADMTQMIQSQWRAIGVDARLRQLDQNTVVALETENQDYEAVLNGWGVGLDPDLSNFFLRGGPYNINFYENAEVTQLIERAQLEPTYERAAAGWRAVANRVVQDQPYTWLDYYDVLSGAGNRLHGMKVDTYGAYQNVWEWWIPADQQQRRGAPAQPAN